MDDGDATVLPALRQIAVGESAYRALEREAAAAADLRARVAALTSRLAHAHHEIDSANHLLGCLLSALDDLERADAVVRVAGRGDAVADGVVLVRRALEAALAKAEVREITAVVGAPFDPSRHESALDRSGEAACSGVVSAVLRRGWERDGVVVRPTLVEVDGSVS